MTWCSACRRLCRPGLLVVDETLLKEDILPSAGWSR